MTITTDCSTATLSNAALYGDRYIWRPYGHECKHFSFFPFFLIYTIYIINAIYHNLVYEYVTIYNIS